MNDIISTLVKKLLAAEDPAEVQAIGAELQEAIRSHIASIREKAAGPRTTPTPQHRKKNGGNGKKS